MDNETKRLNADDLHDVLTVDELAAFIGVTPRMINNMVSKDEIKSFKFGRCRLFLKQDILEMIGYSAELDGRQKGLEPSQPFQDPKRPEVRVIPIPSTRRRGYEAMSMGD